MPPLTADQFGLVQERLAKDPFRLLIAIQFLVRTPGKTSIPVFEDVMKRWPTPQDLAAANPDDIKGMIRKLGLCNQRCEAIQKYARMWCEQPPDKDARYGVKDYPRKGDGKDVRAREVFGAEQELGQDTQTTEGPNHAGSEPTVTTKARGHGTAWEIGHLTFGRYAIDSWRIFCRDVLLGRAEDWKGAGRGPTFQPEWMRVLPEDKELRAYLRWMWMKEGWWWDPHTGDRTLLNNTMVQAVNEGCVAWDGEGELQIVDTPVRNGVVNSHAGGSVQQAGAANGS
ncbi:putative 5-Methylcytosine G/T mismatch-specific DNA glycosylase [Cryphonectria parasitica EP155]|uniref:5-Methylcytosine G/T mismatch-specific DNA glycosylase n=1 Tax=Cryphonectria parasitica (strain ATCC 38755 / EP155) TaxID=660469 RepID=A0A9P5CRS9_CRYP1|nr:putative 5-Methylcytosine G/T mismatch-specific DNA glycosylase [Cryphonectria parasitica EP155]KAF3768889.1 putative 5-Methylcytosine G/T mismatch-specific DNA glycosylase [Cryphonectria parasitica EP155]